jgi:hypothetical protein
MLNPTMLQSLLKQVTNQYVKDSSAGDHTVKYSMIEGKLVGILPDPLL